MNKIIPIVVSTDENYAVPTYITVHSMMKHASVVNRYKVFVLIEKVFSEKKQKLLLSLQKEFENLEISFVNMGEHFLNVHMIIRHTTISSMYRLLLPDILKEYDKCVYMDTDILINGNIDEILMTDIGENYVGGVRDIEAERYINEFDYGDVKPPSDSYINTGILVMNLKKMREDNIVDEFMKLSTAKLLFMDQDIVNICCYGHIMHLPLKYNAMVKYRFINFKIKKYKENVTKYFTVEEIQEAYNSPIIIHYAQPLKPWQCKYIYKGDKWRRYIEKNITASVIKEYISPFINRSRKPMSTQLSNYVKWVLYKIGIYKYLLMAKGVL